VSRRVALIRKPHFADGIWRPPGGGIKPGEDFVAGAVREALEETGIWDEARVSGLLRRCRAGRATGFREGMALIGILSTQLWHRAFFRSGLDAYPPETDEPRMRLDRTEAKEPA